MHFRFLIIITYLISTSAFSQALDLLAYVNEALESSMEAHSIKDSETLLNINVANVKQDYEFQWRPSIRASASNESNSQGLGLNLSKQNEFGTRLNLSTSYEKRYSEQSGQSSTSPALALTIEQDLFRNWGSKMGRLPLTLAELNQQKSYLSIINRKQSLLKNALKRYFDNLLAEKQLALRQSSVKKAEKNLDITNSRYSLGLVSKIEIYRSELALLNAQDSEQSEIRSVKRRKRMLAELINRDKVDIADTNKISAFKFDSPPNYMKLALKARTDWQRYMIDSKINKLRLYQSQQQLQPDIKLQLQLKKYFDNYHTSEGNLNDEVEWNIGLNYNTNFDFTKEKNALLSQELSSKEHQRNRLSLYRKIEQEINDAFDDVSFAVKRQEIAKRRQNQSLKAVELAEIRFGRGLSSNLDLVEAETQLQSANIELIRQQITVNLSLVELAESLGVLDIKWLENAIN